MMSRNLCSTRQIWSSMRTRLVVVKKNKAPLVALANDLKRVQQAGIKVEEIPTLIIDDESDQASLDTKRPSKGEIKSRTAINQAIRNLLAILGSGTVRGYTATPAANVLTDPNDELNIFPRNFIKSLERPFGYMGASDYHDFGEQRKGSFPTSAHTCALFTVVTSTPKTFKRRLIATSSQELSSSTEAKKGKASTAVTTRCWFIPLKSRTIIARWRIASNVSSETGGYLRYVC